MEVILDATNATAGRLACVAAKKALQGDKVIVLNSEKAIITGDPKVVLEEYLARVRLGRIVQKGPNMPSKPEMILRRMIRGMLPWKRTTGREAYRRVKCFIGVPEDQKNREAITFNRKIKTKSISIGKLSYLLKQK